MKWCKNGVVGIKIEIKGLKKPLITIVSAIEKHKVYKYIRIMFKVTAPKFFLPKFKSLLRSSSFPFCIDIFHLRKALMLIMQL